MMMMTASGPVVVSPLDFGDRKKPMSPWVWAAAGVSLLVHGAIGAALYQQRFEIAAPAPVDPGPTIAVDMFRPKPPPVVADNPAPPAPTPPIHRPAPPATPTETLSVPPVDNPAPVTGTVINLTHAVPSESTGVATTPEPPAARPTVITNPSWLRKPTGAQLMGAYPERAMRNGVAGSATLRCAVRLDGTLTGCAVTSETPGGYGFGRSAMGLSRYFRMHPGAVDGRAVDGAYVNVGVRFTLPEG